MSKLKWDKKYITVANFFAETFNFKWLKNSYEYFFGKHFEDAERLSFAFKSKQQQLIGGFQPFADMAKDFIDTFTPYRSGWYAGRDFLQPIYGLGNLLKGSLYLATVVLIFLFSLMIFFPIILITSNQKVFDLKGNSTIGIFLFSWLIDGIGSLIRGATQLATVGLSKCL